MSLRKKLHLCRFEGLFQRKYSTYILQKYLKNDFKKPPFQLLKNIRHKRFVEESAKRLLQAIRVNYSDMPNVPQVPYVPNNFCLSYIPYVPSAHPLAYQRNPKFPSRQENLDVSYAPYVQYLLENLVCTYKEVMKY